jgi:hypothetical protein
MKKLPGWFFSLLVVLLFVGYRELTGSSLTRDVLKSVLPQREAIGDTSSKTPEISYNNGLTPRQRESLLKWGEGECQANMLKKSMTDPSIQRLKAEYGDTPDMAKILSKAFDSWCDCVSTSFYSGDTQSAAMQTCKPVMTEAINKEMYALGYSSP